MSRVPQQTVIVQQVPGASGLAIAGLIFSALGWLTCGLLCILGVALSFFALFVRGPKGVAVAGLIVGFPGILFFIFVGLGIILGFLGLGAAATAARDAARQTQIQYEADLATSDRIQRGTQDSMLDESANIATDETDDATVESITPSIDENSSSTAGTSRLPANEPADDPHDTIERQTPVPDEAFQPRENVEEWRTWSSAKGKYTVEAKFVSFKDGKVTIARRDGKTNVIKIELLSAQDQEYVKRKQASVSEQP